uniref:Uncharacterized protein n=1 Tax=Alexandrium catenella TaxID=2925 RepID=A0A7S1WR29_ALECA
MLSDPHRRAAYDREVGVDLWPKEAFCPEDRPGAGGPSALVLFARLLDLQPEHWPGRLRELSRRSLEDLAGFLRSAPSVGELIRHRGGHRTYKQGASSSIKGLFKYSASKGVYFIKLHWRSLVTATLTTPSLEEAIKWHADLLTSRVRAEESFKSGVPFERAAFAFEGFGHVLRFSSDAHGRRDVHGRALRLTTPFYLDLRSTLQARRLLHTIANAPARQWRDRWRHVERAKRDLRDWLRETRGTACARQPLLEMAVAAAVRAKTV